MDGLSRTSRRIKCLLAHKRMLEDIHAVVFEECVLLSSKAADA
jgi:hypothetical protein